MFANLADIDANNKVEVPRYSNQSYGNTLSDRRNSLGNGFQFPAKRYQGASNYRKNKWSNSDGNSLVRKTNENQDQKQVGFGTPKMIIRKTESSTPRGFGSVYTRANDNVRRCHNCGSNQHLI